MTQGLPRPIVIRVIKLLSPYVSHLRLEHFAKVINARRDNIRVVLDNVMDPLNLNACMRSVEAHGLKTVHCVDNIHSILGKSFPHAKWLDVKRERIARTLRGLRDEGFTVLVTNLSSDAKNIKKLDLTNRKVALVFGNEHHGVCPLALEMADTQVIIPMRGNVQSLNISSACASALAYLKSGPSDLPEAEWLALHTAIPKVVHQSDGYELNISPIEGQLWRRPMLGKEALLRETTVPTMDMEQIKTNDDNVSVNPLPSEYMENWQFLLARPPTLGPVVANERENEVPPRLHHGLLPLEVREEMFARWLLKTVKAGPKILLQNGISFEHFKT